MKPECAMRCTPDVFQGLDEARERRRQRSNRQWNALPNGAEVEPLEERRLLSYSFGSGILTFNGTSSADTIIGYRINNGSGDNVYVRRNAGTPEIAGPYTSASVTKVVINGGAGNDTIYFELGNTDAPFNYGQTIWDEKVLVHGNNIDTFSDGNDSIYGGPLDDTIWGDADDDTVYSWGGADVVYGGYGGADSLRGGDGNDLMFGGDNRAGGNEEVAADEIYGDGDNDTLNGEGGNDWLDGGPGNDTLYGYAGDDNLTGDTGNDYLEGDAGNDTFWAFDVGSFVDTLLGGAGSDAIGNSNSGTDILLDTIPG